MKTLRFSVYLNFFVFVFFFWRRERGCWESSELLSFVANREILQILAIGQIS